MHFLFRRHRRSQLWSPRGVGSTQRPTNPTRPTTSTPHCLGLGAVASFLIQPLASAHLRAPIEKDIQNLMAIDADSDQFDVRSSRLCSRHRYQ